MNARFLERGLKEKAMYVSVRRTKCLTIFNLSFLGLALVLSSRSACLGLSPDESLKSLHVPADFKVDLVASEPLLDAPVAFDWGADGSLWVVEMRDYPLGMDNHGKPGGRIVH